MMQNKDRSNYIVENIMESVERLFKEGGVLKIKKLVESIKKPNDISSIIDFNEVITKIMEYNFNYRSRDIKIKILGGELEKIINRKDNEDYKKGIRYVIKQDGWSKTVENLDEVKKEWRLKTGFSSDPIENTINQIQGFCIYSTSEEFSLCFGEGLYEMTGERMRIEATNKYGDVLQPDTLESRILASLKQTADSAFHQLSFRLEYKIIGDKSIRKGPIIGIAILIRCKGNEIGKEKMNNYLLFEGLTASPWVKNIKLANKISIEDFLIEEIIRYYTYLKDEEDGGLGFLINNIEPKKNRQKNMDDIIKNKLRKRYNIINPKRYIFRKDEEYEFTHYLEGLSNLTNNIHHTHTFYPWQRYVNSGGEIPDRYGKRTSIIKLKGWSHLIGLVNCSELLIDKEEKDRLQNIIFK